MATDLVPKLVDQTVRLLAAGGNLPTSKHEALPEITVGLDEKAEEVLRLLAGSSKHMLLLHGMGGIGKTTLAKAVFNQLYDMDVTAPCCFLKLDSSPDWVVEQAKLLLALAHKGTKPRDESHGLQLLAQQLKGKKVLLVVDNVGHDPLKNLLPEGIMDVLAGGSTVLVTSCSRNESVKGFEACIKYEVELLPRTHSLQLFRRHYASSSHSAPADLLAAATKWEAAVLDRCDGLPKALEVVGKHLGEPGRNPQGFDAFHQVYKAGKGCVFDVIQSSWAALASSSQLAASVLDDRQETLLDIVRFLMKTQPWELVDCYCGYEVLPTLEDMGLVQPGVLSPEALPGSRGSGRCVKVHNTIVEFCEAYHDSHLARRLSSEADDLRSDLVR
jgi:GTPase SAR1 family protein